MPALTVGLRPPGKALPRIIVTAKSLRNTRKLTGNGHVNFCTPAFRHAYAFCRCLIGTVVVVSTRPLASSIWYEMGNRGTPHADLVIPSYLIAPALELRYTKMAT